MKFTSLVVIVKADNGETYQCILSRAIQQKVIEAMMYHSDDVLKVTDIEGIELEGTENELGKSDICECKMCVANRKSFGNN